MVCCILLTKTAPKFGAETLNLELIIAKIMERIIRHFRNKKESGAEMRLGIVSGLVTGEAPVSFN